MVPSSRATPPAVGVVQMVALALSLVAAASASVRADEHDGGDAGDYASASAETQYWNVFTLKVGHLYAVNQPRMSASVHETPETEHLLGLVPSYGRVLIPRRLVFEIALPFFANTERFDTPIDLTLIFPFRFGNFEPYIAVGATINWKIFPGERGEAEGTDVEFVAGFTGGLGLAYIIDEHWVAEFEFTYAWIPTSHIVEHEFAQLAGIGYAF